jgi:hypothetical protein
METNKERKEHSERLNTSSCTGCCRTRTLQSNETLSLILNSRGRWCAVIDTNATPHRATTHTLPHHATALVRTYNVVIVPVTAVKSLPSHQRQQRTDRLQHPTTPMGTLPRQATQHTHTRELQNTENTRSYPTHKVVSAVYPPTLQAAVLKPDPSVLHRTQHKHTHHVSDTSPAANERPPSEATHTHNNT